MNEYQTRLATVCELADVAAEELRKYPDATPGMLHDAETLVKRLTNLSESCMPGDFVNHGAETTHHQIWDERAVIVARMMQDIVGDCYIVSLNCNNVTLKVKS